MPAQSALAQPANPPVNVAPVSPSTGGEITDEDVVKAVDEAIALTKLRNLDFQRHTPWQILHGLLALRGNYTIKNGDEFVNALEYLSTQARFKGKAWFETTRSGGRAQPYNGTPYDFEGHVNQSLAIIAMSDVPLTYQFTADDGKTLTMSDMVRHAQAGLNPKEELTWTLWFLTHYLDQDTSWSNSQGQRWSMEALVKNQNNANLNNSACGGCHNLFAVAYARNAYMQKHGQLRGAWLESDHRLQQQLSIAKQMQNRDGSFATQYFKARGFSTEFNERIKSSGHMLEWILVAVPKKQLSEQWLRNGVYTLARDMIDNAAAPADCGPLYHSLHALVLYKQRVDPNSDPTAPLEHTVAKPAIPSSTSTDAGSESLSPSLSPAPVQASISDEETETNSTGPQGASLENAEPTLDLTLPGSPAPMNLKPVGEIPTPAIKPVQPPKLLTPEEEKSSTSPLRSPLRGIRENRTPRKTTLIEPLHQEGSLSAALRESLELSPVPCGMPIYQNVNFRKVNSEKFTFPADETSLGLVTPPNLLSQLMSSIESEMLPEISSAAPKDVSVNDEEPHSAPAAVVAGDAPAIN